jgi:periplasmic mercuric ion binding protein
MRQLFVAVAVVATVGLVQAAANDTIKCKADGLHLCCGQCEKSVQSILSKVDGVTAVKIDRKAADKVTFEASSDKVANDAVTALLHGGFACEVTAGDKKLTAPKIMVSLKSDQVTVTGAHVCCGACIKAVTALFKDSNATVAVNGTGTIRDIVVSGKNLDGQTVLDTLQKGGFTGTVQAKK